jgi:predicted phage-related endonuclease
LATELNHFWTQNVLQLSPPDPVELKDARALYKHTIEDKSITADDSTISTLNEFILIQSEVRAHQFRERELKAEIMKTMKDSEYILDEDGNKLVSWKKSRPSVKFDSKTFEQDHPDLHQTYLKEMEGSRRFLVKK